MTMSQAKIWLIIGFAGQAVLTAVPGAVDRLGAKRDSVVPVAFWWLSLLGGLTLLSYASYRQDPVIIVGQGMGLVVYARNLMLVGKAKRAPLGGGEARRSNRTPKRQHMGHNHPPHRGHDRAIARQRATPRG